MSKQVQQGKNWYAIHTYSGYEDNVMRNLMQRIESMGMEDKIFNVLVPKEKKIKIKAGKRKIIEERIFPGYVLVQNIKVCVGLGTSPTGVSEEESEVIKKRMGVSEPKYKIDVAKDDAVKIVDGPFKGFDGRVSEVDEEKGKIKVLVSMFGRETPIELDFLQIKKI